MHRHKKIFGLAWASIPCAYTTYRVVQSHCPINCLRLYEAFRQGIWDTLYRRKGLNLNTPFKKNIWYRYLMHTYRMSTYFRLELSEPSARIWGSTIVFSSGSVSSPALLSHDQSPKNKYVYSRRLYKLQAKTVDMLYLYQALDKVTTVYQINMNLRVRVKSI